MTPLWEINLGKCTYFFCAFSLPSFQSNRLSPAIGQINHPGGPFYWLISQLSFHDHPLSMPSLFSLLSHTFKIFIIKHIRLCFFFFLEAPISRLCLAAFYFHTAVEGPAPPNPHPPPGRRWFFVSCFSAAIITQSRCHWLLCKVKGNTGLEE